jgi:hypothetical protein
MEDNTAVKPRGRPSDEGRFIWAATAAIERIVNQFGTAATSGIAVYIALTKLSSSQQNNPAVTASIAKIGGAARLGYRTTWQVIHRLAELELITIQENRRPDSKSLNPSTYTLLSMRSPSALKTEGVMHDKQEGLCKRKQSSIAENPKRNLPEGEREEKEEETAPCATGTALPPTLKCGGAVPVAGAVSKKMTWDAEGER